jgi:hypothetical protein
LIGCSNRPLRSAGFLSDNAATYGSRKRSKEVDSIMASLWRGLGGSDTEDVTEQKFTQRLRELRKAKGVPMMTAQQLVERYCFPGDYGVHYGLPSKISHASQIMRGFAEHHGCLRYYSGIENANVKAALAAEYLIELIGVLKSALIPAVDIDPGQVRKRLRAIQRGSIARSRLGRHGNQGAWGRRSRLCGSSRRYVRKSEETRRPEGRHDAEIHVLDAGHLALDEATEEIASLTGTFLAKHAGT